MGSASVHLPLRSLTLLAAACLLAGCAGADMSGMLFVTHDKYTAFTCDEIAKQRRAMAEKERQLSALSQKAEAAPGGVVVNAVAYSTELANVRAELNAADYAGQQKACGPLAAEGSPPPAARPGSPPRSTR